MELSYKEVNRISETLDMIPQNVRTILEVGCGDGRVTNNISKKYTLTGIDIDQDKLKTFAGEKIVGDISRMPIKGQRFDLVLSTEVLEHLSDEEFCRAIEQIPNLTIKYILITVPFMEILSAQWNKCSKCGHIFHGWGHKRSFDKNALKEIFKGATLIKSCFFSPRETKIPFVAYVIAKKFGNVWGASMENHISCPICGAAALINAGNAFGKLFIRLIWRLDKICPFKKPIWVGCLYLKTNKIMRTSIKL